MLPILHQCYLGLQLFFKLQFLSIYLTQYRQKVAVDVSTLLILIFDDALQALV
jgi:hypothetical protein